MASAVSTSLPYVNGAIYYKTYKIVLKLGEKRRPKINLANCIWKYQLSVSILQQSGQYSKMIRAAVDISEAASRTPIRIGDDCISTNIQKKKEEKKVRKKEKRKEKK